MELWGWRWMERGVLVMGDGERVGVVRGEPASSGGGVLGAAEAVPRYAARPPRSSPCPKSSLRAHASEIA